MPFGVSLAPSRGPAIHTSSLLSATSLFSIPLLLSLCRPKSAPLPTLPLLVRCERAALPLPLTSLPTLRILSDALCQPPRGSAALMPSSHFFTSPLPIHLIARRLLLRRPTCSLLLVARAPLLSLLALALFLFTCCVLRVADRSPARTVLLVTFKKTVT